MCAFLDEKIAYNWITTSRISMQCFICILVGSAIQIRPDSSEALALYKSSTYLFTYLFAV